MSLGLRDPTPGLAPSLVRVPLLLAAIGVLTLGWSTLQFTCDDAYIAFRYVHNHMVGRGWTWNPPPFAPVEGYTSFAWLVLLELVWRATGVDPPSAANLLGLGFGVITLLLAMRLLDPLRLPRPTLVLGLVLLGTVTNRTFLQWTTSGLETSMFTAVFTWWLVEALGPPGARGRMFAAASLLCLVRPDGYLFLLASFALLAVAPAPWPSVSARLRVAAPALMVFAHLLWRRQTYGHWLPNTYFAKATGAWPEAGARYLASFVIENGVVVWIGLVLVAALVALVPLRRRLLSFPDVARSPGALVSATMLAHAAFYIVWMGGDHFEYRVFAHLILPLYVSGAWLAQWISPNPVWLVGGMLSFTMLSWPIAWTEWRLSLERSTREDTTLMVMPVADALPGPLKPAARAWEALQRWLVPHEIGVRLREHQVLASTFSASLPARRARSDGGWADGGVDGGPWGARPLTRLGSVGVVGWTYADVAIIDVFGLNDLVVARWKTRAEAGLDRRAAHDRLYPAGYMDCWRFNVTGGDTPATLNLMFHPEVPAMTDDEIRRCETIWFARALERKGGVR
ncbi:MAG: hypothetical protein EXR69_16365 [Myxococcales bacterium]|nr:hypothetical protein [Myxococcales bacterium]